jgi:hypothetical protein
MVFVNPVVRLGMIAGLCVALFLPKTENVVLRVQMDLLSAVVDDGIKLDLVVGEILSFLRERKRREVEPCEKQEEK